MFVETSKGNGIKYDTREKNLHVNLQKIMKTESARELTLIDQTSPLQHNFFEAFPKPK